MVSHDAMCGATECMYANTAVSSADVPIYKHNEKVVRGEEEEGIIELCQPL